MGNFVFAGLGSICVPALPDRLNRRDLSRGGDLLDGRVELRLVQLVVATPGRQQIVVGALPFSLDDAAALTVPESFVRDDGPLEPHSYYRLGSGSTINASIVGFDPSPKEHEDRITAAISTIQRSVLEKIVLARSVDIQFNPPVDPLAIAARLIDQSHNKDGFVVDLSPAGGRYQGRTLVGSSPEVLIKREGSTVSAYPLAGSAGRVEDRDVDCFIGQQLRTNAKDLDEHTFVVNHLVNVLEPLCSSLDVPNHPELTRTNEMWHLATPITGTLRDKNMSALELALNLHPTPAVCGTPLHAAEDLISSVETDRGFYSGAVGWCTSDGNGEYMVAIRCAEIAAGGASARAWAGGGIVASSSADKELAETTAKLRTIMRALGLQ